MDASSAWCAVAANHSLSIQHLAQRTWPRVLDDVKVRFMNLASRTVVFSFALTQIVQGSS